MDQTDTMPDEERYQRWLARTAGKPPEEIAAWVESPTARWVVITEDGPDIERRRFAAYLNEPEELPYWAFVLAKSYLDDVGEWPLYGLFTESALAGLEEHGDPARAVREIIATVNGVWPDLAVISIGEEEKE